MGISENIIADEKLKAALENDLLSTKKKYPIQDLINWMKTEDKKTRKTRWQKSENNMKNMKKEIKWNRHEKMKRRDQVVNSRSQTGYTMVTHGYIINKQDNNKCPFCNVRLSVDHILWECKETEGERQRANIQNNIHSEK
jgi:hypothetical protein